MFDGRALLNAQLASILLAAVLATGCVAGPFIGPSTMRCTGGAEVTHYDPDYVKYECGDELVVTGSLSDNATTLFGTIAGLFAGLMAPR